MQLNLINKDLVLIQEDKTGMLILCSNTGNIKQWKPTQRKLMSNAFLLVMAVEFKTEFIPEN